MPYPSQVCALSHTQSHTRSHTHNHSHVHTHTRTHTCRVGLQLTPFEAVCHFCISVLTMPCMYTQRPPPPTPSHVQVHRGPGPSRTHPPHTHTHTLQEIAMMSGLAAAERLGAGYPFPHDAFASAQVCPHIRAYWACVWVETWVGGGAVLPLPSRRFCVCTGV